jgi:hypothetical protein
MRVAIGAFFVTISIGLGAAWAGESAPKPSSGCFTSAQFNSWKAPDANTIYIRVSFNRYFRLDLTKACTTLAWPDAHLVMTVHGPQLVCSPLDFDLKASESLKGFSEPCFVTKMTKVSKAAIEALPQEFRP